MGLAVTDLSNGLIIGIGAVGVVLVWVLRYLQHPRRRRHRLYRKYARQCMSNLKSLHGEGAEARAVAYLRKINPLVFEELLLECFERRGLQVVRNPRYTGDGGIDGVVVMPDGRDVLLQAKRYKKHIAAQHIAEFVEIVCARSALGVFVHTGRTGELSRAYSTGASIEVISGSKLVRLIRGDPIQLFRDWIPGEKR